MKYALGCSEATKTVILNFQTARIVFTQGFTKLAAAKMILNNILSLPFASQLNYIEWAEEGKSQKAMGSSYVAL